MVDLRAVSLVVLALALPACFPWQQELARCYGDGGKCKSDAGEPSDAGLDYELALWPVPSESPDQYLVGDLTVLDQRTLLVWQKTPGATTSWPDALRECDGLNTFGFGGLSSRWRLPTAIELLSLVDSTRSGPAINPTAFPKTTSAGFWTASVDEADGGTAWEVGFDVGDVVLHPVAEVGQVRCVTSDPPVLPTPRYRSDVAAGVVLDAVTGLTWEQATASTVDLTGAQAHCTALDAGWRLPAKKELETLVNRRGPGSMLDPTPVDGTLAGFFWSATPVVGAGMPSSWGVDFSSDQSTLTPDVFLRSVRCVR